MGICREGVIMNYIVRGLADLKYAIMISIPIYVVWYLLMFALKIRKNFSRKCIAELLFCIYSVLLLKVVGIFSLHFSLDGIMNYSLVPFLGSSFVPVLLNFLLFVPYGFLITLVFTSCQWNWKKILCVGALTSLTIEILQMFGGRYAEIDDFLINTFGTLAGYLFFICLQNFRENRKKTVCSLIALAVTLGICFSGIYFVGNHSEELPDGLFAVQDNISEIRIYYKGENQTISLNSDIYNHFAIQVSNCDGHLLEVKSSLDSKVMNDTDCFIEILFDNPQTISFHNAEDFSISNADRVIYNSTKNILYWGYCDYQYYVDYIKLNAELEEHKADILPQYQELQKMIVLYFE